MRKTLGQHEIATVQTTAIDQTAGMVNLTTTLAHASGEWIASDWPVCPIAETANPQRMGAALTYARRYACSPWSASPARTIWMRLIFVMVLARQRRQLRTLAQAGHGQPPVQQRKPGNGQRRHGMHGERPSTLEPEQSAALREKLLTAVGSITSADSAAIWAREALAAKNRLAAADAKLVEDAFEHRLSELAPSATVGAADDAAPGTHVERVGAHETRREETTTSIRPRASTRACSSLRHRGAIETASTFAMLPDRRVSSAAANNPIRIISLPAAAGARPQGQR